MWPAVVPAEAARWAELKPRLEMYSPPNLAHLEISASKRIDSAERPLAALHLDVSACSLYTLRSALSRTRKLPEAHQQLLLCVGARDAVLFTSNGGMLRRLPLNLETPQWVHEPRWLCGFEGVGCSPG